MEVAGDPLTISLQGLSTCTALGYLLERRLPEPQTSLQAPAPPPGGGVGRRWEQTVSSPLQAKPRLLCTVGQTKSQRSPHGEESIHLSMGRGVHGIWAVLNVPRKHAIVKNEDTPYYMGRNSNSIRLKRLYTGFH